jgi:hypothetical protein
MAGPQRIRLEGEQAVTSRCGTQGYCAPACPKASHRGACWYRRRAALTRAGYQCQEGRAAAR